MGRALEPEPDKAAPRHQVGAGWRVELLPNAATDALRCFGRLPSAASAQAATRGYLRSLELFPADRQPNRGSLLDTEYEKLAGEAFYRLRLDDQAYGGVGDVCVFFAAIPHGPRDGKRVSHGRIVVLGICWWNEKLEDINIDRARNRYEHYIKRRR